MTRRGAGRVGCVLGLVLMLLTGISGVASADTVVPPVAGNASAIADWPVALQQLVAGTAAFQTGPWYADPSCKSRGGNVGIYINAYLAHEKDFWLQLAKSTDQGSNAGDAQKFIDATGGTTGFDTWPGATNIAKYSMPNVCADTLKSWATPDATSVWGFSWVATPDETSMSQMMSIGVPTGDDLDPHNVALWGANSDTAYLKSRAMYVNCDNETDLKAQKQCRGWNYAVQNLIVGTDQWKAAHTSFWSNVGLFVKMAGFGVITAPTWVMVGAGFVLGLVGKTAQAAADWAAKKGMDQVVSFFTSGLITMWGAFTAWMINFSTPNLATGGFVQVYDLIAGIMYGLSFLGWLLALMVAWRRGKLARSFLGGVRAVLAIQLIPVIAYLMLTLSRECTRLLISGHVQAIASAKFATSLVAVNPVVALLAGIFGTIGLVVALIILIFQIPLVFGHALFGVIAGAGQANPATSGWLSKWFFTFLSLCWTPFFMVALAILGQDLTAGLDSNTTQNVGQQMATVLGGLLIMLLLPTTPWLLSGIMSVTTGRVSAQADAIGEGVGSDLAGAAAGTGADLGKAGAAAAGACGAGTWGALASMGSNMLMLDQMAAGASAGGGGEGGDAAGSGSAGRGASGGGSGVAGETVKGAAAGGPDGAAVAAVGAVVGAAMEMAAGEPTSSGQAAGGQEADAQPGPGGPADSGGQDEAVAEQDADNVGGPSGSAALSMAEDLGSAAGGVDIGAPVPAGAGDVAAAGTDTTAAGVGGAEPGGQLGGVGATTAAAGAPAGPSSGGTGAAGSGAGGGAMGLAAAGGVDSAGGASSSGLAGGGLDAVGGRHQAGSVVAGAGAVAAEPGEWSADSGGLAAGGSAGESPAAAAPAAVLSGDPSAVGGVPSPDPAAAAAWSPTSWFDAGAPTSAQLDAARGSGVPGWAAEVGGGNTPMTAPPIPVPAIPAPAPVAAPAVSPVSAALSAPGEPAAVSPRSPAVRHDPSSAGKGRT